MKISEFFIVMYIQASDFFRIFQILLSAYCVFMCYYILYYYTTWEIFAVWINYLLLKMMLLLEMLLGFCLNQGYFIEEVHDGEEGLQKFDSTFDLLIIDIMMPNISGIDVCRKIREKSYVPILFLTAKSLETDKMEALSAGGDDYLVKPFSYVELIASYSGSLQKMSSLRQCRCIRQHSFIHYWTMWLNLIHKMQQCQLRWQTARSHG